MCITEQEFCDGVPQCYNGDDENGIRCMPPCPDGCVCKERRWKCESFALPNVPLIIPYIDLSNHVVNMSHVCAHYRTLLMYLDLSNAGLDDVSCLSNEILFPALRHLDLSNNEIQHIPNIKLPKLKILHLENNPIKTLELHLTFSELLLSGAGISEIQRFQDIEQNGNNVFQVLETFRCNLSDISTTCFQFSTCSLRKLDLSRNELQFFNNFGHCDTLNSIDLRYNKIERLSFHSFNGLSKVEKIRLNNNFISSLDDAHFQGLSQLTTLMLHHNMISTITTGAFYDLENLSVLNLSYNHIQLLNLDIFVRSQKLNELDLSNNRISRIERTSDVLDYLVYLNLRNNSLSFIRSGIFESISKLKTLDLRLNSIEAVTDIFTGLGVLQTLYVDSFTLCCFKPTSVDEQDCVAPVDIFSSCANLIDLGFLHICIWLTALLSIFGNIMALTNRIRSGTWIQESRDILVSNLCISDMLMGIYLIIVAYKDVQTRGNYGEFHNSWRNGILCKIGGTLVTASSEMSTLCIFAITADRYLLFKNPFSHKEKARRHSLLAVTLMWVFSLTVAILPDVWTSFFGDSFYGRSSVCISLPLTQITLTFKAWEYSVALFIVFNLVVYCMVVAGQVAIFLQIRNYSCCILEDEKKKEREIAVAKSLSVVVISDTLCWLPIAVLGKIIKKKMEIYSAKMIV